MTRIVEHRDPAELAAWLETDVAMNIFGLCDLDPAERPHTRWLGLEEEGQLAALLLVYTRLDLPLVLLHGPPAEACKMLEQCLDLLPERFHLSVPQPLDRKLSLPSARFEHRVDYFRMTPTSPAGRRWTRPELCPLGIEHAGIMRGLLYDHDAYGDAWFSDDLLHSGLYRGWIENGELLGAIGVHAVSGNYRVAATGNLAVRPDQRGRGIARMLKEGLLAELNERGWRSAFNVRSDNRQALAFHARLGCHVAGTLREYVVTRTL
ncbi:MAG: GNAT family N-acetyltransferase [Alphaproteobacteria bacterium]|nr:GNAT family N-acetyltransferase [Alphaproteobacteria bacterium]